MSSRTRRQVLALSGVVGAGLAGCVFRESSSGDLDRIGGEWPVVGREPGQTRSVDEGPDDPEPVWTTELDGARAAGTPSVADDRVYVPVDAVSDRARYRYRLHALEAKTGAERWRVSLRSEPNPSPAVYAGRIVVSARRNTERGRLVAFDERDGAEDWLYDVDARVTAPPTVGDILVYLPDWEGYVHAVSIADGSVRWSRRIGSADDPRSFARPIAVRDDALYLGSSSGRTGLVAVDAATGDERWARSTDRVTAGPVVDDGLVVVRGGTALWAFDTDGTERWNVNVPGDAREAALALDDRHVYVPTRDALHAIDRGGEPAWSYEPETALGGPTTIAGDRVLVAEDGTLTALDRTDGTPRWSVETIGAGDPVATPGAVFLRGSGGRVTALGSR